MKKFKKSKLKIIKNTIYFLGKLMFHYMDQATDILLILDVYQRSINPDFPKKYQDFYFLGCCTLIVALGAERYLTYNYFVEVHKKDYLIKNHENQKEEEVKNNNLETTTRQM